MKLRLLFFRFILTAVVVLFLMSNVTKVGKKSVRSTPATQNWDGKQCEPLLPTRAEVLLLTQRAP
jgi:hypothetical protein